MVMVQRREGDLELFPRLCRFR